MLWDPFSKVQERSTISKILELVEDISLFRKEAGNLSVHHQIQVYAPTDGNCAAYFLLYSIASLILCLLQFCGWPWEAPVAYTTMKTPGIILFGF